jgi:hypothetical protein
MVCCISSLGSVNCVGVGNLSTTSTYVRCVSMLFTPSISVSVQHSQIAKCRQMELQ